MRDIVILGSTGSIGVQALEVIAAHLDKFRVVGLSAGSQNLPLLFEQAKKFGVNTVGTTVENTAQFSYPGITVIQGTKASSEIASMKCDVVLNAITGSIGLEPTLAALEVGNLVALANKESLVAGGTLVTKYGRDRIIPVDSEHSAIFQCMMAGKIEEVSRTILTASGGAFRDRDDLSTVTVSEALAHPTWSMGPVVTINSASLMNKALEIVEAHHLFGMPYEKIEAVIHPQSYVHSLVEYQDGSTLAHVSPPNMKGPIAYALGYPERVARATSAVDWTSEHRWDFYPVNLQKYPVMRLVREIGALPAGPTIMNAANEIAVSAFMHGKLRFVEIMVVVEKVLDTMSDIASIPLHSFSDVSAIEDDARRKSEKVISLMSQNG